MFAKEELSTNNSFDLKRWEMHRSSKRYRRMLVGILFGSTTRRVFPTVAMLVTFFIAVDLKDYPATIAPPHYTV